MTTFGDIAKDINKTRLMLIAFYCSVWFGATIQILRDLLPGAETFWDKVASWLFAILLGGCWPVIAGATLMGAQ